MTRGTLLTVAVSGDYGKPRPAVVVQSDWLSDNDSVLVCLLTTSLHDAPLYRLTVPATSGMGLRETSQVMVDKIVAVRRSRCGPPIGHLDQSRMLALNRLLALVLGIGD